MPAPADVDPKAHPFYGKTMARCRVEEALGRGRTSWVCRAHHTTLDREVAIKILSGDMAELDEIRQHFLGEARALAQIDHPHIVKVLDVVDDAGHICILMEYVAGETLQDRLNAGGTLPVRKALRIALQMAQALAAAHAEKIVHRDVKPANVLLESGTDEVKMVDFGLAGPKTLANRAGTPLYMSPEACQGKRIDEKSDVYALGVCLYQMLTGKLPHTGKTVRQILASHVKGEYEPVSRVNPPLGKDYDELIKKLMVPSKGYRPSAAEAAELIEPFLQKDGGRGEKRGRGGKAHRGRGAARGRAEGPPTGAIVAGIVGVVILLAVILIAMNRGEDKPVTPPDGNSATAGNTVKTVTPPPPPPTPEKDPAQVAYEETEAWAAANDGKWDELALRWGSLADMHPGTKWGDRARENATKATERKQQEAEIAARAKEREAREAAVKVQRDELDKLLAGCDFGAALKLAETLTIPLPGETLQEWHVKKRRISFLDDTFLKTFNENVAGRDLSASYLKEDAGHDEVIVGADTEGVNTRAGELPRRTKWTAVPAQRLYDFMAKKIVSTTSVEGNVFLYVLAKETGLPKVAEDAYQTATYIASPSEVKNAFDPYR